MALDASLILGGRGPQLDDPLTIRAKQATLADLMGRQQLQQMQMQGKQLEMEDAQRARQDQQTLAEAQRAMAAQRVIAGEGDVLLSFEAKASQIFFSCADVTFLLSTLVLVDRYLSKWIWVALAWDLSVGWTAIVTSVTSWAFR